MSFPLLDTSLRNYIFIPLTIITICVSLLMKYLNTLFNKGKKPELHSETKSLDDFAFEQEMKTRDTDLKIQNSISRANLLKDNYMYISEKGFKKRQAFFNEFTKSFMPTMKELAVHFENGAKIYGEHNCEKGIPKWSFIDSGLRHLTQFLNGEDDENHYISILLLQ